MAVQRRGRRNGASATMATMSEFTVVVNRPGCLRGVSTPTAFGLAAEIGDRHRLFGRGNRCLSGFGGHRIYLGRIAFPEQTHRYAGTFK